MDAFVEFYNQASKVDNQITGQAPILDCSKIRAELAVLFYDQNQFEIHKSADVFEGFEKVIIILHAWNVSLLWQNGQNLTLEDCLEGNCDN